MERIDGKRVAMNCERESGRPQVVTKPSPWQRPGDGVFIVASALKGHTESAGRLAHPFSAESGMGGEFPGRCPGLGLGKADGPSAGGRIDADPGRLRATQCGPLSGCRAMHNGGRSMPGRTTTNIPKWSTSRRRSGERISEWAARSPSLGWKAVEGYRSPRRFAMSQASESGRSGAQEGVCRDATMSGVWTGHWSGRSSRVRREARADSSLERRV